ncbi:hypothetical protein EX30DRAFT_371590 [Ascodesmis nigricans]|uniref:Transcription factor n=1 Tax=Ascodesmis nigricans TaxID=341454 RepID=A0A4S2MX20_9PEZI|nr:hypothetical protein EX30DRAFT_371590 [Ascodesmis nigricans]
MEGGNNGGSAAGGGGSGNSSSDFVRKLYKMLEDPNHQQIVRWSASKDSFVVVDPNLFTTKILPQHFKHSNFASFVRQLNKYDFHKIKSTEEGAPTSFQEFRHPDFRASSGGNLDNIRRKAPTSRKTASQSEDHSSAIEDLKNHIINLEKHIQRQEAAYRELAKQHTNLVSDLTHVHAALQDHARSIMAHNHSLQHLGSTINEIKRGPGVRFQDGQSPSSSDHTNRGQQMMPHNSLDNTNGNVYNNNSPRTITESDTFDAQLNNDDTNGMQNNNDMFSTYPGQSQLNGSDTHPQSRPQPGRKRSQPSVPNWGIRAPRVLLVEDDPTCRRIGSKFLEYAECEVDIADDGLIAVNKMGHHHYDLVLMDIMMPHLDGCTAAQMIRRFDDRTPIVAMTSNIRRDDIQSYFANGMDDVLPKPFTKDGLLQLLERVLGHLKKDLPDTTTTPADPSSTPNPNTPSNNNTNNNPSSSHMQHHYGSHHPHHSLDPANDPTPAIAGLFGTTQRLTDLQNDPSGNMDAGGMLDEGGYVGMMGGFGGDGGYTGSGGGGNGYTQQQPGQRRRRDELVEEEDGQTGWAGLKKQRY